MTPTYNLKPGASRQETFTVQESHTAPHVGSGQFRVLATPSMIAFMEINTRKLLDELLPEGYTTVGVHVDIGHRAPANLGSAVTAHGEIQIVDGDRITLAVEVRQGDTIIGAGTHRRHVIEIKRFLKRLVANQST